MKITIDLNEAPSFSLSPCYIYRALHTEYWGKLQKMYHNPLWGMATVCDSTARELYARRTGRSKNVKNLILTYHDAEACFELFKQFAKVWAENISNTEKEGEI